MMTIVLCSMSLASCFSFLLLHVSGIFNYQNQLTLVCSEKGSNLGNLADVMIFFLHLYNQLYKESERQSYFLKIH